MPQRVVLSVAPHPDDELLGAPATLLALRDAGWRVRNLACSLGSARGERSRRRRELERACRLARFELVIPDQLPPIGRDDDLSGAQAQLASLIAAEAARSQAALIIGPSPHDGHPGHEVVGRAIRDAVEQGGESRHVMFWGLWADLPLPNMVVLFDSDRLAEIDAALAAYAGELARNSFDRLLAGRAAANAVLGPERVFGFGADGLAPSGITSGPAYAELLSETRWSPQAGWRLTPPWLFAAAGVGQPAEESAHRPLAWWLHAKSVRDQLREI